jgi:hypothetical protein
VSDPIPMLLWCPGCGERHLDEGEFATKPHHTHACQLCGLAWRPAVVDTLGVQFLPGFRTASALGTDPPKATTKRKRTRKSDHNGLGNCWRARAAVARCAECGMDCCDVCHQHDEPRGECSECPECEACAKDAAK